MFVKFSNGYDRIKSMYEVYRYAVLRILEKEANHMILEELKNERRKRAGA